MSSPRTCLGWFTALAVAVPLLLAAGAWADPAGSLKGWQVEKDVDPPSYAVIEPMKSNLNIDTVVLVCSGADRHRILQFEVYLTDSGPLLPAGADRRTLRRDPRGQILIDGQIFPVTLSFAEDFVVVADAAEGRVPVLSRRLLDALERGKSMVMRFALAADGEGFDGQASVDLRAGAGGAAVAAVRRCLKGGPSRISSR